MRGTANNRGYTIVEVMLFLAVSGFMFLIAANFVNGKQQKAEFRQGLNSINSQVRAVINDVGNGYFPSTGDFGCTADAAGSPPQPNLPPQTQGANQGCVFLGKVIQFGVQDTGDTGYNVYSIAGRQYLGKPEDGTLPTNFAEAKPVIVPSLTDKQTLDWGLKVIKVTNGSNNINGVGFFTSFGNYDSGGSLQSGAQNVIVIPISGSNPADRNESEDTMAEDIKAETKDGNVQPNPSIVICFEGGAGQYGTLTIGGNNGQRLSTSIKISNSQTVCP